MAETKPVRCPACAYEGSTWEHRCKGRRFMQLVERTAPLEVTVLATCNFEKALAEARAEAQRDG